ncbi:hypothetical protein GsuE55_27530 [Geobacillus subterraneus]|uniref:Uncharacterized protein n=2 Tax=Geobacillus TaxID=129337 RepID=A0A679FPH6_9BACL|nr:hypothetical protein [Geobacillus icigianus]BBW97920.1 hypothetical protein GsuE55_27530 [Geobacillus subterraneus]
MQTEKHKRIKANFSPELRSKIQKLYARNNWYNFLAIGYDWFIVLDILFVPQ